MWVSHPGGLRASRVDCTLKENKARFLIITPVQPSLVDLNNHVSTMRTPVSIFEPMFCAGCVRRAQLHRELERLTFALIARPLQQRAAPVQYGGWTQACADVFNGIGAFITTL